MHVAEKSRAESAIRVIPTGKPMGADIVGVDLSKPLADAQFQVIFDADNRCALHKRTAFDPQERRFMLRTQIKGGKPQA